MAKDHDYILQEGNYCFVSGPSFESHLDIQVLREFGACSVGMSTVPEIFGARQFSKFNTFHSELNVVAFSLITNMASGVQADATLSHEEVFETATSVGPYLQGFVRNLIDKTDLTKLNLPETPTP